MSEQKEKEKEELPMKKKNSKPLGLKSSVAHLGKKMRGEPFCEIFAGKRPSPRELFLFFFLLSAFSHFMFLIIHGEVQPIFRYTHLGENMLCTVRIHLGSFFGSSHFASGVC